MITNLLIPNRLKVIKYLILLILLIIIGGGLYITISNRDYDITHEVKVKTPRELAFNTVKNFDSWKNWINIDQKNIDLSFSESKDSDRSYLIWKDKMHQTEGQISTKAITHYSTVIQKANSKDGLAEITYKINWKFEENKDTTKITTQISAHPNFFTKINMLLSTDKTKVFIDTTSLTSLSRLKAYILNKMAVYKITIEGVNHLPTKYYTYKTEASANSPATIDKKREEILESVAHQLEASQLTPKGAPIMVYNSIDETHNSLIFSAGYPVSSDSTSVKTNDRSLINTIGGQAYLKGTLRGDYNNIPKLWEKIRVYIEENDLTEKENAKAFEILKVTSHESKNPAERVTELYVPIQEKEINSLYELNQN